MFGRTSLTGGGRGGTDATAQVSKVQTILTAFVLLTVGDFRFRKSVLLASCKLDLGKV
jgi:hypothetical protein